MEGAAAQGLAVRVAGAGHSFTPVVGTDGVLLDLPDSAGIVRIESDGPSVTVRGGTRIAELGDPLWEAGLTLMNMGDIDTQAVAGAVATGTHGTGIALPSMSASLHAARLVTASGDIVEVGDGDGDLLRAARVSIGLLGVMTELTLELAAPTSCTSGSRTSCSRSWSAPTTSCCMRTATSRSSTSRRSARLRSTVTRQLRRLRGRRSATTSAR